MSITEDEVAIRRLHDIFAHAADRGDYAMLRSLYTVDGWDDHTGFSGPADDYMKWVEEVQKGFEILAHFFSNLILAIDGDTAVSTCGMQLYLRVRKEPPYNSLSIGRSFDTYAKAGGQWLFKSRFQVIDWTQTFPADESVAAFSKGSTSAMNRTDPFFRHLPALDTKLQRGWRGG